MALELRFTEFEINMIYGFVTRIVSESEFINWLREVNEKFKEDKDKQKLIEHGIRDGWCSTYQMNSTSSETETSKIQDEITQFYYNPNGDELVTTEKERDKNSLRWEHSKSKLTGRVSQLFTFRKDGTGTLTITIKFPEIKNELYNTSDILRALLLVPRTFYGPDYECTKTEKKIIPPPILKEKEIWDNLSYPFQLFVNTLIKIQEESSAIEWSELSINRENNKEGENKDYSADFYNLRDLKRDPQIPYFYVFAKIPYDKYKGSFLEEEGSNIRDKREARKKYSKEITAILGRWITEQNIPYTSFDYWEQRGVIRDSSFFSQYMNSLVFTTFSGLLALSFYPDLHEVENENQKELMHIPIEVTHESILRCLEIARMRWHEAMWLSKQLDVLITDIVKHERTKNFIPLTEILIFLAEKIALHLEDPNSYLWDSSVGNRIAEFLHRNIIEKLEGEISKKLEHARKLIEDKLKIVRTMDYIKSILNGE